jgi:hypothetical protein
MGQEKWQHQGTHLVLTEDHSVQPGRAQVRLHPLHLVLYAAAAQRTLQRRSDEEHVESIRLHFSDGIQRTCIYTYIHT